MKSFKYVIIGNSAAGIGCAEGIRQIDKKGTIAIISDEKHHTYSRPLISYLLEGKTDLQRMKYRPDNFYKQHNIVLISGEKAISINKKSKTIKLEKGEEIKYEKLLAALGSSPFIPPMDGLEQVKSKFTFMKLDDAINLDKELSKDKKILIVGAGLIGLKCAEGIYKKSGKITIIDLANRILPSILDEDGSVIIQKHIESKGINFILNDSVSRFESNSAFLKSGNIIEFDILVIAVGVRPNVSLIKNAGGKINKGICTNEKCETSLPDIYSAGDCTESFDITCDKERILALLPNAYMQGECAGINMAGGQKLYDKAIPMNAIGFFGLHLITAGSYEGNFFVKSDKSNYKKLFFKDDLLKGYIMIGDVNRGGIYTRIIREKIPLSTLDFELIKERPQLMAFELNERKKMLANISERSV